MLKSYGSGGQAASRVPNLHRRQAIVAALSICAVTLLAATYAGLHSMRYRGSPVDLLQISPKPVLYVDGSMLDQLPQQKAKSLDNPRYQQLSEEKEIIGDELASDMRKLWAARSPHSEKTDEKSLSQLRSQFEKIVGNMHKYAVLSKFRGPQGQLRAVDSRNGDVYQPHLANGKPMLYEDQPWNVNPVFIDDSHIPRFQNPPEDRNPIYQGVYPEYSGANGAPILYEDQPWNVNPVFIDDSHIPRFQHPPEERNPIYQGVYPEYFVVSDGTGQLRLVPASAAPALFAAPHSGAPQPASPQPVAQAPFQSQFPAVGTARPMWAAQNSVQIPQMRSQPSNPQSAARAPFPSQFPVVDPARAMWAAQNSAQMRRMRSQLAQTRRARAASSSSSSASAPMEPAKLEHFRVPGEMASVVSQAWDSSRDQASLAAAQEQSIAAAPIFSAPVATRSAPTDIPSIVAQAWDENGAQASLAAAPEQPKAVPTAAAPAVAAAPMVAAQESVASDEEDGNVPPSAPPAAHRRKHSFFAMSGVHSYNTVYDPSLDPRVNPGAGADEITQLRGPAKTYFKHYQELSRRALDVHDPAGPPTDADWWTGPQARDNWWQHDHTGRGY